MLGLFFRLFHLLTELNLRVCRLPEDLRKLLLALSGLVQKLLDYLLGVLLQPLVLLFPFFVNVPQIAQLCLCNFVVLP